MQTEERVIAVLRELPPECQAEVLDFVEFLKARQAGQQIGSSKGVFAGSQLEDPDTPSVYKGDSLTLEKMRDAIDWEASERR